MSGRRLRSTGSRTTRVTSTSGSGTTGRPRQSRSNTNETNENYTKRRNDAEESANASKKNTAGWAALGIGAVAAAAIVAASLAAFASSDGANITFTNIKPETNTDSWVPDFFQDLLNQVNTPKNIEITWKYKDNPKNPIAIPKEVKVIKGDMIDIHDLPSPLGDKLNNTQAEVLKVKSDNVFVIDSKTSNSSNVDIQNQGYGTIHTSFDDHLDETTNDALEGIADKLGKFGSGILEHLGTVFFVIFILVGGYFGVKALLSLSERFGGRGGGNGGGNN